jgi:predicted DNA-binding protein (MmcQ/YjbR family)
MDATGTIDISYDQATHQLTAVKLHKAGDIILNERNEPIYKWRKGDIVLDALGKPVYKDSGLGLNREIDIFLFDAKYYFANSATTMAYKEEIIRLINGWVNTEMRMLNGQLLERSEMFYYPTITKGTVKIKADNDKLITINSQQSIRITFFMSETKYNDAVLRDSIKQSSIKTLHDGLQRQTVSKDSLLSLLRETIGNDIVSVDIEGFLHDNWTTATLLDPAQRLSYNKVLTLKSNGEYDVEDDVTVRFLIHTPY